MRLLLSILFVIVFYINAQAQQELRLEVALAEALANNHNVRIAKNSAEIASNADNPGNAGLLPTLSGTAGYQYAENNTTLEFLSQDPSQPNRTINVDGAVSTVKNAALNLNYTLFDGLANIYTKNQLELSSDQAALQLRQEMEQTVAELSQAYVNAFLAAQEVSVAKQAVDRSMTRYERAKENFELGVVNRVEALAAEVDLNTDSLSLQSAQLNYRNSVRNLFFIMGREEHQDVALFMPKLPDMQEYSVLKEEASAYNTLLQSSGLQLELAQINYRLTASAYAPRLVASGSYNWTRTENDAGLLAFQENTGFTGGVTLNVGLFNGFQRSIARQNAALSIKNARLQLEQSQLQTQNALASAWDAYQNALLQTQVLNRNVQTSTLNYERSMELFQQGQLNAVQIRDAQLALQQAEISLLRQQLQAFLAKVELQRLSGRLIAR